MIAGRSEVVAKLVTVVKIPVTALVVAVSNLTPPSLF
jgi:hypothetical protein